MVKNRSSKYSDQLHNTQLPNTGEEEVWRKFSFKNFQPDSFNSVLESEEAILKSSIPGIQMSYNLSEFDEKFQQRVLSRWNEVSHDQTGLKNPDFFHLTSVSKEKALYIDIPGDSIGDIPISIQQPKLETEGRARFLTYIRVGENSKVQILECIESSAPNDSNYQWMNSLTVLDLDENSEVEFLTKESHSDSCFNFRSLISFQNKRSRLQSSHFYIGGFRGKIRQFFYLDGEHSELEVLGITAMSGREFIDHETMIHHRANFTDSKLSHKAVVKDKSHHIFTGNLHIPSGLAKVKASQVNHNLSLNHSARAESIPKLEIFCEDVQSSHGSTVGEIDDDQLFYLLSRGLDRDSAYHLLVEAFITEILDVIGIESQREWIQETIKEKIWPSKK